MCWAHGSAGHVAVVEKVEGNTITISESHYSGTRFNTKTGTQSQIEGYLNSFQGYIYIGDFDPTPPEHELKYWYDDFEPTDLGYKFSAYIEHKNTKMYLTGNEDKVTGQEQNGGDNQKWNFTRMDNGAYIIITFDNSKFMDVWGSGTSDNTVVHLYNECTYEKNQQFFIYEINGSYYFRPLYTDKVLDMKEIPDYNLAIWTHINDHTPQMFDIIEVTGIIGDADGNGKINILDATAIQKLLVGLGTLTSAGVTLADVDQNGKVNILDATAIQKYLVGLNRESLIGQPVT